MKFSGISIAILVVVYILLLGVCSDGIPVTQTDDRRDPSVARLWNEVLLDAIRNDFARPTVHARNIFHISAAMYDAWAVFDVRSDKGSVILFTGLLKDSVLCVHRFVV